MTLREQAAEIAKAWVDNDAQLALLTEDICGFVEGILTEVLNELKGEQS